MQHHYDFVRGNRALAEDFPASITERQVDDGGGLEAREMTQTTGRGLINMCERVAALGGTIDFEDRPGAGLKVQVVVPVISEEKADDGSLRH